MNSEVNEERNRVHRIMVDSLHGLIAGFHSWSLGEVCKLPIAEHEAYGYQSAIMQTLLIVSNIFGDKPEDVLEICFTRQLENWCLHADEQKVTKLVLEQRFFPFKAKI